MAKFNMIDSKIEDIAKLRFLPLPVKPTPAARAIRVGNAIVVIGLKGEIYTSQAVRGSFWLATKRMDDTVEGLIRLGALSPDAVAQHKAAVKADNAARAKKWKAQTILDVVEGSGITLTAAQRKKLTCNVSPAP